MTQLAWSAGQYLKFEDERTRPARDLLARVPLDTAARVVDLGCGPGNSTELLVERFGGHAVSGLDSDDDMLEKARARLPQTPFVKADLASWRPDRPADLLYANAVFQWLPDHLDLLAGLMEHLSPGGVLAVQMPDNLGEPSHLAMEETGADGPWSHAFADGRIRRARLPAPADYLQKLQRLSTSVDVWSIIIRWRMHRRSSTGSRARDFGLISRRWSPASGMRFVRPISSASTPPIRRWRTGDGFWPFRGCSWWRSGREGRYYV